MIFGIGTDLVDIHRMSKILEKDNGFRSKVFTDHEISYCESKSKPAESYAARFAAKEAFFKALGTGWEGAMQFAEIEVINNPHGKPKIQVHGEVKLQLEKDGIDVIHLSLSHAPSMAVAMVVLEKS